MNSRTKVHVLELSQAKMNTNDDAVPTEEYMREDEVRSSCQRQLLEIFRPILIVMKLTGQYFGETVLVDGDGRTRLYISKIFSALIILGQWFLALLGVISLPYVGFSSMSAFFFLLITTGWYIQCASNTTVSLFVLPITGNRRSRFAKFLSSYVATSSELDGMKKKAVSGLILACLAAGINIIVIIIFSARTNGVISILPPWNQHPGMHLTLRVVELVFGFINSFAWTLLPMIFCVSCMLLEKMFSTLQNKVSKELVHSYTIGYLRQEHLKLCEVVELANAVFSPLLFVIISLDIPLMCVNFYQLAKNSSEASTIVILSYIYWSFCISTLMVVIFYFGNRVNEKAHSFYETLQKNRIYAEDTSENTELMLFLAHLRGEPIGLSVGGIAVINKDLFLTVFGIIASYFVVLLTLPT